MSKITVFGMGAMGSRMAISLLKAGHEITVWNRNKSKTEPLAALGARVADNPRIAVEKANFVISMLKDDRASEEVWLNSKTGAINNLSAETIAIESSTLTVDWTKKLAERLHRKGINFLDAPVAGSRIQADAGQLIYFVGGDSETLTQAMPILKIMGSKVLAVGSIGSGMAIKLAVNALFSIQVSAFAELIGLMKDCELDESKAVEIIASTPVCSGAAKVAAEAMIERKFAPMFPIELVAKDLSYALNTARTNKINLPLTEKALSIFDSAIRQGYGDDNITGIARLYF